MQGQKVGKLGFEGCKAPIDVDSLQVYFSS